MTMWPESVMPWARRERQEVMTIKGYADLDGIFHPRSVAVIGVSNVPVQAGLLEPFVTCGFKGNIYPVGRSGGEIFGLKIYPSLSEIPGPVDYAVFGTPAASVPSLIEECVRKGVKAASFFTGGFSEVGTAEGKELQARILGLARKGGMRLIGPNCLGLYCPGSRIAFIPDPPLGPGPVALFSQSGGNCVYAIRAGAPRGLRFSKVASYGNAVDIDESELLEYFAADAETKIIGGYIEGFKDGSRFDRALRTAASKKPVVIMKGGKTGAGARSCLSHTGSLAGGDGIWRTVARRNGALLVASMEEMIDSLVTFRFLPPVKGTRAAVVGWGGGASVQAADECEKEGLTLPCFPEAVQEEMANHWMKAGSILDNPVDTVSWTRDPKGFRGVIDAVARWDGADVLILHMGVIGGLMSLAAMLEYLPSVVDTYVEAIKSAGKPAAIILHSNATSDTWAAFYPEARKCVDAGVPVYHSFSGAARAIVRYSEWCNRRCAG